MPPEPPKKACFHMLTFRTLHSTVYVALPVPEQLLYSGYTTGLYYSSQAQQSGAKLGNRDVDVNVWHTYRRLGRHIAVSAPTMSNVCHTPPLPGPPLQATGTHDLHRYWVSSQTSFSSMWCYKAVSEFSVNLGICSSWFQSWITLLSKRASLA